MWQAGTGNAAGAGRMRGIKGLMRKQVSFKSRAFDQHGSLSIADCSWQAADWLALVS